MRQASLGTPENTLHSDAGDGGGRIVTDKVLGLLGHQPYFKLPRFRMR